MRSRITLACASNMSDTYFRNTSPSTGCLYSAADTEPRSLLAVSHSVFLNSSLVMPAPDLVPVLYFRPGAGADDAARIARIEAHQPGLRAQGRPAFRQGTGSPPSRG